MAISRFAYFQFASETYVYNAKFARFVYGSAAAPTPTTVDRTCETVSREDRQANKLYDLAGPLRTPLEGTAPWWFAFEDNTNGGTNTGLATLTHDKDGASSNAAQVVGDRGLVVRDFTSKLGGVDHVKPSFSVLCDKIELGMPQGAVESTTPSCTYVSFLNHKTKVEL